LKETHVSKVPFHTYMRRLAPLTNTRTTLPDAGRLIALFKIIYAGLSIANLSTLSLLSIEGVTSNNVGSHHSREQQYVGGVSRFILK